MTNINKSIIPLPELRKKYMAIGTIEELPGERTWMGRYATWKDFLSYGGPIANGFWQAIDRNGLEDTKRNFHKQTCPALWDLILQAWPNSHCSSEIDVQTNDTDKMNKQMWMVRADSGGRLAFDFKEKGIVAIGWHEAGDLTKLPDREAIVQRVAEAYPDQSKMQAVSGGSQLYRFLRDIKIGDRIIAYDNPRRVYMAGKVTSESFYDPTTFEDFPNVRKVEWLGEVSRDDLSTSTRNSLGAIQTLFALSAEGIGEIEALLRGKRPGSPAQSETPLAESDLLRDVQSRSQEFIKDYIGLSDS